MLIIIVFITIINMLIIIVFITIINMLIDKLLGTRANSLEKGSLVGLGESHKHPAQLYRPHVRPIAKFQRMQRL